MKAIFATTLLLIVMISPAIGQRTSIFGEWKTIDDETGEAKSIVEITERNGKAYGKIVELVNPPAENPDPVCKECTDHRKGKKVKGLEILTGLERDGDEWVDGEILDPENGKVYDCKVWVEDGKLKVRGYVSILYRTQTWLPAD